MRKIKVVLIAAMLVACTEKKPPSSDVAGLEVYTRPGYSVDTVPLTVDSSYLETLIEIAQ